MAVDSEILIAALAHLNELPDAPPIAWPGVNFTPPGAGEWLEARHFPNQPRNLGWESNAAQEYVGFVQVSACARPGSGIVGITQLAERVIEHFAKGTPIGPVKTSVRPYLAPAVTESTHIFIPVTIPYLGIV